MAAHMDHHQVHFLKSFCDAMAAQMEHRRDQTNGTDLHFFFKFCYCALMVYFIWSALLKWKRHAMSLVVAFFYFPSSSTLKIHAPPKREVMSCGRYATDPLNFYLICKSILNTKRGPPFFPCCNSSPNMQFLSQMQVSLFLPVASPPSARNWAQPFFVLVASSRLTRN